MWNLLMRRKQECTRLGDKVEEAAAKQADPLGVDVREVLTAEERKHLETCQDCQEAIQELFAAKELFHGVPSFGHEARPWFAARVMAAIVLLASTTWFYESVVRTPSHPVNGSQESIFDAPQQSTPDDILISQAGDNP